MPPARARRPRGSRGQRGNVALMVALTLPMMMMFVALAVDMGNIYRVRGEVATAADSAALAGASGLDGTNAGTGVAVARGVNFGTMHYAHNGLLALGGGDVVVGIWDFNLGTFTPNNAVNANAVRATVPDELVVTPFAAVMGTPQAAVGYRATAVGGGPWRTDCAFPLVIADCHLQGVVNPTCDVCMNLEDLPIDNAAWTTFGNPGGGNPAISAAVQAACFDAGGNPNVNAAGECIGQAGCNPTQVGGVVDLAGANLMTSAANDFCVMVQTLLLRNGVPEAFTVEVPVVESGAAGPGPGCELFTQSGANLPVVGHTRVDIFGASCVGGPVVPPVVAPLPFASGDAVCNAAVPAGNALLFSVHRVAAACDPVPRNVPGGGGFFGTKARPRLVQ